MTPVQESPMMKRKALLLLTGLVMASQASATVLFADDFQTNLSQWNPGSGVITAAPGGGNALAFTATIGGGDSFALSPISAVSGSYTLTFDYLGTCGAGQSCGGYIGFNNGSGETWLSGSGGYPTTVPIIETGAWQTITVNFTSASPFTLKIEDWNGATDGPTAGNAFFRNLVVSSGGVPEPATWLMLVAGFGMVGVASRRKDVVAA